MFVLSIKKACGAKWRSIVRKSTIIGQLHACDRNHLDGKTNDSFRQFKRFTYQEEKKNTQRTLTNQANLTEVMYYLRIC